MAYKYDYYSRYLTDDIVLWNLKLKSFRNAFECCLNKNIWIYYKIYVTENNPCLCLKSFVWGFLLNVYRKQIAMRWTMCESALNTYIWTWWGIIVRKNNSSLCLKSFVFFFIPTIKMFPEYLSYFLLLSVTCHKSVAVNNFLKPDFFFHFFNKSKSTYSWWLL